jgi:hypothetical protein
MDESYNAVRFAYEFSETATRKADFHMQKNVLDFFAYDQIHNNI